MTSELQSSSPNFLMICNLVKQRSATAVVERARQKTSVKTSTFRRWAGFSKLGTTPGGGGTAGVVYMSTGVSDGIVMKLWKSNDRCDGDQSPRKYHALREHRTLYLGKNRHGCQVIEQRKNWATFLADTRRHA